MIKLDASTIAREVNAGRLDPVAVVEAFAERIEARNTELNALVRLDLDWSRRESRRLLDRVRQGQRLPLAGVPLVVKDTVWVKGRNQSQGSRLFADFIAPSDAICVERARAAGAVVIGIGNSPEFACKGQTNSPLHGIARHPMNPLLTPGGSSGGNAAALAADFAPIALGTDGGGSGRRPPAHTGTVGFKPSFGAIPYGPGFPEPFWGIAVIAPMGRTVADTALLFDCVAGPDPRDAEAIAIDALSAPPDFRSLRIAYSPRLGLDVPVDAEVAAAIETGIGALAHVGWPIERTDLPWPADLKEETLMPLQAAGLAALHGDAFAHNPSLFDPDIAAQLQRGLAMTGRDVAVALEASAAIRRACATFLTKFDLLLSPTTPCVAWSADRLGPERIGGVPVKARGHAVFTPFFNHALTPAISIPCGRGHDNLPVGLQIVARRGRDLLVLAAAAAAENVLSGINLKRCPT